MGKDPEENKKDDEGRDPAPVLIEMDDFVPEEDHNESAEGDDQNPRPTGNSVAAGGVDELRTHNDVCGRPTYAGE